jgi:hypothetical protein
VEQGILVEQAASLLVQLPGVIWVVLSVVTLQKYLSDIDRRLFRLEQAMQKIQGWLDNLSQGEIEGSYRYLRQLCQILSEPNVAETDLANITRRLEDMELDCLRLGERERLNAKIPFDELTSMELSGPGVDEHKRTAVADVKKYERHLVRRIQNCFVRATACELRSAFVFVGQSAITKIRIGDIREEISSLSGELDRFEITVRDRLPELKGIISRKSTDHKHQLELSDTAHGTISKGRELIKEMLGGLSFAEENIMTESGGEVSVYIEIDEHGKLSGIRGPTPKDEATTD